MKKKKHGGLSTHEAIKVTFLSDAQSEHNRKLQLFLVKRILLYKELIDLDTSQLALLRDQ